MESTEVDERGVPSNEEHENSVVGCDSGHETTRNVSENEGKSNSSICSSNIEATERYNQGHSDFQFHCREKSDFQTKNKKLSVTHKRKHVKTKEYKCNFCDFQSTGNSLLLRHIKNIHSEFDNNNYVSQVRKDYGSLIINNHREAHYDQNNEIVTSSVRTNENEIRIEEHPLKFEMSIDLTLDSDDESERMLRNNIEDVSNSESTTSHKQTDNYNCGHYRNKTPNPASLKQHSDDKHNDEIKTLFCQLCSYHAQSEIILAKHMKNIHEIDPFLYCQICRYRTKNEFTFIRHFRSEHTKREFYTCKFCNYFTKCKRHLVTHLNQNHRRRYNGLQCQLCKYFTSKVGNYEEHMITHHKFLECEDCTYKTKSEPNLVHHMRDKHGKNEIGSLTASTNLERYMLVDLEEKTDSACEIDSYYIQTNLGFLTDEEYLEENVLNFEARDVKSATDSIIDCEKKLGSFSEMSGQSRNISSNINRKFLTEGYNLQMDVEDILPQFEIGPVDVEEILPQFEIGRMSVNPEKKKALDSNTIIDITGTSDEVINNNYFPQVKPLNENVKKYDNIRSSKNKGFIRQNGSGRKNQCNNNNERYKNKKSSSRHNSRYPKEKEKVFIEDSHYPNNDMSFKKIKTGNIEISDDADASIGTVLNVFNLGERESTACLSEKASSKFNVDIYPEDLENVEVDISWM